MLIPRLLPHSYTFSRCLRYAEPQQYSSNVPHALHSGKPPIFHLHRIGREPSCG